MNDRTGLRADDLRVLRALGEWQAQAAASAVNQERIRAWYAHDAWAPGRRPMVVAELLSLQGDNRPITEAHLQCGDPWARQLEHSMLLLRYHHEVLRDDWVVPASVTFASAVWRSDFGVPSARHRDAAADALSFNYQPPLTQLDDIDLARLRHRTPFVDRPAMDCTRARLTAIFESILPVRMRDNPWQFHIPLTSTALDLVGMQNFMMLMHDNPDGLHRLMAFLRDDQMLYLDWLEAEGLLPLNNEDDYVGAGSVGYTRDLPARGFTGRVRLIDRWSGFESQESVGIGPEQYGEYVFAYMRPLMARVGKVYYGCCEPTDVVWQYLSTVPNLARVSVSPWANEEAMGRACRERKVVYSRKPTPNLISGERFDDAAQRDHFAKTVAAAQGCSLEIIQRDVYVLNQQPDRFTRWVELARSACAEWRE